MLRLPPLPAGGPHEQHSNHKNGAMKLTMSTKERSSALPGKKSADKHTSPTP